MTLTDVQKDAFMTEAIAEARLGWSEGEAPIGCVLVLGSGEEARIVARGHNRANALGRKNAHAEIVAFENAGGDPPALPPEAEDVALFSTLEPCVMCYGAAIESGVPLIVFGMQAPLDQGTTRVKPPTSPETKMPEVVGGVREAECRALFTDWLAEKEQDGAKEEQLAFVRQTLQAVES